MKIAYQKIIALIPGLIFFFTAQCQPPASKPWRMTFHDEFSGPVLDASKWSLGFGWGMNSGAFSEINLPENVYIEDSSLVIKVDTIPGGTGWYSGAINSRNLFAQRKGYFEARIKMAPGLGLLNAFWSKPVSDAWPPEIDFAEILGRNNTVDAFFTLHYTPGHIQSGGQWKSPVSLAADYHVYGFEWSDKDFVWYVDGIERRRTSDGYKAITDWNEAFYLMFNVHVACKAQGCSDWTGTPNASNVWPSYMKVDWVRVYEIDNSLSTSINNRVSGEEFPEGIGINVGANAANSSGLVSTVKFYADEVEFGESLAAPYSAMFNPSAPGRYKIIARVFNEDGTGFTSSAPVFITVSDHLHENLIINPEFDMEKAAWELQNTSPYQVSFSIDQTGSLSGVNSARISVTNGGSSLSNARFFQKMYVENGKKYLLSFQASSSVNRKTMLSVRSSDVPYNHKLSIFDLTSQPKTFQTSFDCTKTDFNGLFEFSVGSTNAEILIDSIVLVESTLNSIPNERSNREQLFIYPNPASSKINVSTLQIFQDWQHYCILSPAGKVFLTGWIDSANPEINIEKLSPGIYFLKYESYEGDLYGKFLKN